MQRCKNRWKKNCGKWEPSYLVNAAWNPNPNSLETFSFFVRHCTMHICAILARIICSWQCCRLLFDNIANGIVSSSVRNEKIFFEILVGSGIQFRQWLVYIDFLIDSHKELFSFLKKSIFVLPPWCLTLSSHVCSRMGRGHNCWRQGCWSCNTNNNSHSISTNISSINVAWA